MTKRDPHGHKEKWGSWKRKNQFKIENMSKHNSDLILSFLKDMEIGVNVSLFSKRGGRSYCRLNGLKSRLIFFAKFFQGDLDKITREEIHKFFVDLRGGIIVKPNGTSYIGISNFI